MSPPARAHFSLRGEVYLLVSAWASPGLERSGYERVEAELAAQILARLPAALTASPGVRGLLARASFGAGSSSPVRARQGPAGVALYRRAVVRARAIAPLEEAAPEAPAWEPEPPPLLDLPKQELAGQAAIAATLLAAAASGAPFCEKCENCQ